MSTRSRRVSREISRVLVLASLALGACYSPSPPAGAYTCFEGSCPSGQSCICAQCVHDASEAACSFSVKAMAPACAGADSKKMCVKEHEAFPVAVTALTQAGTPATHFHGGVSVGSSWGDATLVEDAVFASGAATLSVSLNREIRSASGARVSVRAGGALGTSATGVQVDPPAFKFDSTAALSAGPGWVNLILTQPDVVREPVGSDGKSGGLRMYFAGFGLTGNKLVNGVGLATSSDGASWAIAPDPLILADANEGIRSPSVYQEDNGTWTMLYESHRTMPQGGHTMEAPGTLRRASSSDGKKGYTVMPGDILTNSGCSFCVQPEQVGAAMSADFYGIAFPQAVAYAGGYMDLYFSTIQRQDILGQMLDLPVIGHASSIDSGKTWDIDPSPSVTTTRFDQFQLAPRVFQEGSVYKMYYLISEGGTNGGNSPCGDVVLSIGYATSSDGLYWLPSQKPVLRTSDMPVPWSSARSLIPGTPMLVDANDPRKGIQLYFSTFSSVMIGNQSTCLPNGVGRAVRP